MNKILELNSNCYSQIQCNSTSDSFPHLKGGGKFQAVIVHADTFKAETSYLDLGDLMENINPDRLIEVRLFNDKEEHRILRVFMSGKVKFIYRHITDGGNQEKYDYDKSVDTFADFYKNGNTLLIRNYIKKRGLLNSYDDMRFVEFKRKNYES